jgi:C-terminal processing protease CtpA/Prc
MDAGPDFYVSRAEREALVAAVLKELDEKYLFPHLAAKNRAELTRRWADRAMEATTSAHALMARMNADFLDLFHDKHLRLLPATAIPEAMLRDEKDASAAELAEMAKIEARQHFGIVRAEILEGNIGYLEILHFPYVKLEGLEAAVRDAMGFVGDTDGLIVDLRRNGGGDGDTVALFMSYLLDERTLLSESYDRLSGKTTPDWTRAEVSGRRYGAARRLWVLTSKRTFSGGEAFAYAVQTLKRGAIVGETTGGGGHYVKVVRVSRPFLLLVAVGTATSPITHTNWEGVGVRPDIETSPDRALGAALELARKAPY